MADTRGMGSGDTTDPFRTVPPDDTTADAARDSGNVLDADDGEVSGWFERTPSGWRARVDPEAAAAKARREPHVQALSQQFHLPRGFDGTQFVGFIKNESKFARNGDMIVTIQIPYEFKHLAFPLTDAVGLPLSFDVQLWKPYREAAG